MSENDTHDEARTDDAAGGLEAERARRSALLAAEVGAGRDPWPHRFDRTRTLAELTAAHDGMEAGTEPDVRDAVAGRVMLKRDQGKLVFLTIQDRDDVLQLFVSRSEVAARFGQLMYTASSSTRISVVPAYTNRLVRVAYTGVALRHHCHARVVGAIQSALTEIAAAGLGSRIDVANSNTHGGCFVSRYARFQGAYGTPSRHAWGIAFDVNTVSNAQGKVPVLDCDVVRIMRRWGFAWGGNFLRPDGMHFEWAGGRRDLLGYPSRYCPNLVPVPETERPAFPGDPPQEDPDDGTDEPTP